MKGFKAAAANLHLGVMGNVSTGHYISFIAKRPKLLEGGKAAGQLMLRALQGKMLPKVCKSFPTKEKVQRLESSNGMHLFLAHAMV